MWSALACALLTGFPSLVVGASLCAFPTNEELTPPALAAKHAMAHYAAEFPAAGPWEFHLLGNGEANRRNIVPTFVPQAAACAAAGGVRCDGVIGPGYSSLSVAMSPLVEVPWLCFYATSTALSDKDEHPAFSRVIPNDDRAVFLAVQAIAALNWTDVSFFSHGDYYGESQGAGLRLSLSGLGGTVHRTATVSRTGSAAAVRAALAHLTAGPTRVIYVAMLVGGNFETILDVIAEDKLDERFIFVFGDGACSASDNAYRRLRSALCVTLQPQSALAAAFVQSYTSRDTSADMAQLQSMGVEARNSVSMSDMGLLHYLAHDATLHMMRALEANAKASAPMTGQALIQFMRDEVTTNGSSGLINLTSTGEREQATYAVYNANGGQEVVVARFTAGVLDFVSPDGSTGGGVPQLQLLGQTMNEIPSALFPIEVPQAQRESILLVVLAALVALVLVSLSLGGLAFWWVRRNTRSHRHAPQDAAQPFAIVFTDIQASTALWGRVPAHMSAAVESHHEVIRHEAAKTRGYEVKTIGDSFMVAFKDPVDAVRFSLDVQVALLEHDWGSGEFDDYYDEIIDQEEGLVSNSAVDTAGGVWSGLRVRVGVHYGDGTIQKDSVTQSFDYYGTVVNTAARVEAVSHGGQVCVTAAVVDALGGHDAIGDAFGAQVTDLGPQPLRGLDEPVAMTQLLPTRLAGRRFPPLRLDIDVEDEDESTSSSIPNAEKYTHLSATSMHIDPAISNFRDFLRTLNGPLKRKEQAAAAADLVRRWQVKDGRSSPSAGQLEKDANLLDRCLSRVLARAVRVHESRSRSPGADHDRRLSRYSQAHATLDPRRLSALSQTSTAHGVSKQCSVSTNVESVPTVSPTVFDLSVADA